jgi:hypothetical protein
MRGSPAGFCCGTVTVNGVAVKSLACSAAGTDSWPRPGFAGSSEGFGSGVICKSSMRIPAWRGDAFGAFEFWSATFRKASPLKSRATANSCHHRDSYSPGLQTPGPSAPVPGIQLPTRNRRTPPSHNADLNDSSTVACVFQAAHANLPGNPQGDTVRSGKCSWNGAGSHAATSPFRQEQLSWPSPAPRRTAR